jgi:hypothetical protein
VSFQISFQDWLLQSVRYFRRFGFFKKYQKLSDEDLAANLHQAGWYGNPNPSSGINDLSLLALDEDVVWWQDIEANTLMGTIPSYVYSRNRARFQEKVSCLRTVWNVEDL